MKTIHASSDKNKNGEGYLPAKTLWRTVELIRRKGIQVPPIGTEPAPLERLGATIGILRRRKRISHQQFAQWLGCSVEALLALEAGLLPAGDVSKYLPVICRELGLQEQYIEPLLRECEMKIK